YQDAVATEAYLGTARKRLSVRRHARLLDYFMHEGCNARAFLFLEADANNVAIPLDAAFATSGEISEPAALDSAVVFQAMHPALLQIAHNQISFHTWSDTECCLLKGATRATLKNSPALSLQKDDLLLFEEERSPTTGNDADRDWNHRHIVRLIAVESGVDPVDGA